MKTLWTGVTLLVVFSIALARAEASLDSEIKRAIANSENVSNVGVAVGVIHQGQVLYQAGFGYADRSTRAPVTARSRFVIASMSKAFTGLLAEMAAEERLHGVSDPLQAILPDLGTWEAGVGSKLTLEDLLSHRTGLARHDVFWYASDHDRYTLASRLRFLPRSLDSSLVLRKGYQYNNLAFGAAGVALERIFGQTWEDLVRNKIFSPLGMSASGANYEEFIQSPDRTRGYAGDTELPAKDTTSIAAAAAISSNVEDMLKWAQLYLRKGVTEQGVPMISEARLEDLFVQRADAGGGVGYGLGWRLDHYQKYRWFRHAGNMDGYLGVIHLIPETQTAVVILTNQNDTPVVAAVQTAVLKELLGPARSRVDAVFAKELEEERGDQATFSPWTDALLVSAAGSVGTFEHPAYGAMTITESGGQRELQFQSRAWKLARVSSTRERVTLDLGGRTQDFTLTYTQSGFDVSWDDKAEKFSFVKQVVR